MHYATMASEFRLTFCVFPNGFRLQIDIFISGSKWWVEFIGELPSVMKLEWAAGMVLVMVMFERQVKKKIGAGTRTVRDPKSHAKKIYCPGRSCPQYREHWLMCPSQSSFIKVVDRLEIPGLKNFRPILWGPIKDHGSCMHELWSWSPN